MDRNECVNAEWYAIGLEDGARGRPVERLGEHRRACAKHNVMPDTERYVAGRDEGLNAFCTYERGFSEGRAGNAHVAACPQGSTFLAGYKRGRDLYEVVRRRGEIEKEITRLKAKLGDDVPDPDPAQDIARLEALIRESEQLEMRIQQAR